MFSPPGEFVSLWAAQDTGFTDTECVLGLLDYGKNHHHDNFCIHKMVKKKMFKSKIMYRYVSSCTFYKKEEKKNIKNRLHSFFDSLMLKSKLRLKFDQSPSPSVSTKCNGLI